MPPPNSLVLTITERLMTSIFGPGTSGPTSSPQLVPVIRTHTWSRIAFSFGNRGKSGRKIVFWSYFPVYSGATTRTPSFGHPAFVQPSSYRPAFKLISFSCHSSMTIHIRYSVFNRSVYSCPGAGRQQNSQHNNANPRCPSPGQSSTPNVQTLSPLYSLFLSRKHLC